MKYEEDEKGNLLFYPNLWKTLLYILVGWAFAYGCWYLLRDPELPDKSRYIPGVTETVLALGVMFFSIGGLLLSYSFITDLLHRHPEITIYNDRVEFQNPFTRRSRVIEFRDVEQFIMFEGKEQRLLKVLFYQGKDRQSCERQSAFPN